MNSCTEMVTELCTAFEHPVNTTPTIPDMVQQRLRLRLCSEEIGETIEGFRASDTVEIADGLADTVVVVIGSHLAFGLPVFEPEWRTPPREPHLPKHDEKEVLVKLLKTAKEHIELAFDYLDVTSKPNYDNLREVTGALDIAMSVVQIVAYRCGIDFMPVFKEVHRSNMSKIVDGKVMKDEGGKVIKPEGYTKPDIAGEIERQFELHHKKLFSK